MEKINCRLKRFEKIINKKINNLKKNLNDKKKFAINFSLKYFEKLNNQLLIRDLKMSKNIKVVILAGGLGTRLPEYTKKIPKPMVKINGTPIIVYIMSHYVKYGLKNLLSPLVIKGEVFQKYFKNFKKMVYL